MRHRSGNRSRRSGAVLMAALFCLAVVIVIAMSLARSALVEHRQALRREQQLQSFWLAESAAERAVLRASNEPDYSGETWRPQFDAADSGANSGAAIIRVEKRPEGGQKIVVEASYPESGAWRIVSKKEVVLQP